MNLNELRIRVEDAIDEAAARRVRPSDVPVIIEVTHDGKNIDVNFGDYDPDGTGVNKPCFMILG